MTRTALAPFACLLALVAAPARAQEIPSFADSAKAESDVLATLNLARVQPTTYVETLMTYRGYFKANLIVMPGRATDVETQEGAVPVDEAIEYLQTHAALRPFQPSAILQKAAADQVAEQGRTGGTGHFGEDGGSPGDRVLRHGGGEAVAEVIAYGAADGEDVVRQLIIDDGVTDRGHRVVLFSDHLRYAGIACGPHPTFGTVCVIDMADTPDAADPVPLRRVSFAAIDPRRGRR